MLEKLEPRHYEEWISYPDGKKILIETLKTPYLGPDGSLIGILGVSRDITERKNTEQTQRQLLLAQKTVEFKQNFLANMSHEIRTPLTGILGMIEILNLTPLNDHQQDYVNTLEASGCHLKEIIDQVLDFSRLEAGKTSLKPVVFSLNIIINNAIELYKSKLKPGVQVFIYNDTQVPEFILADKQRLSQILNNIISNGVKFTQKGSVTLHTHLVSVDNENKNCVIKVEIKDTGEGIPKSMQEKLFTPFYQIEMNDKREYDGTGLGLSISKQLVNIMGGEIGVISDEGKGSTFWFTFQAQIASNPKQNLIEKRKYQAGKKLNILFAEDKVVTQKVVKLMLSSIGHSATIANNGQEAIDLFQSGQFDLILMDIQMPIMDGITATQKLKEKHRDLPPIIGLSANAFEGDREKYMALGMDEYLTKPVRKEDFEGLIGKLF